MDFVSIGEMRTKPGAVWQQLEEKGDIILTSSGWPFALMINVGDDDVEQLLLALRRARAQLAVTRMRQQAMKRGLDQMSAAEIDTEISQTRQARHR